jgi:hypothetical protein
LFGRNLNGGKDKMMKEKCSQLLLGKKIMAWLLNRRIIVKQLSRISVLINTKYEVKRRYGGSFGKNVSTLIVGK